MKHLLISSLSTLLFTAGADVLPLPSMAQFANVKQHLNSLTTTRVVFARGKSSTTIENAENNIYILRAKAGQTLTLKVNSLGARASVTLYGVNGKPLSPVFAGAGGEGKSLSLHLAKTGDYYIVGGSGPTNHLYNFTIFIK
ncbi:MULTISPECIES: hypothetical protein [unclassified Nostoc]|uniref:hypothetical protein n=1 Tax=unclassified Nostoc TaxID=2593658 RepID=UPI0026204568|nr:hypothetical protein [Nostoc sp. S13]MDF5737264.1 hypothetical protein [Nostoc sp. S13]